jgi:hypothetical protein
LYRKTGASSYEELYRALSNLKWYYRIFICDSSIIFIPSNKLIYE